MPYESNELSLAAARRLRRGNIPHIAPAASPCGSVVELRLTAPANSQPEAVFTDPRREHGWRVALAPTPTLNGEAGTESHWVATIRLPQEPTALTYHFVLADGRTIREQRQKEGVNTAQYGVWAEQDYRIAVYTERSGPPAWVHGQIAYQIFPDSFAVGDAESINRGAATTYEQPVVLKQWGDAPEEPARGRDFYGGDLRGVIEKLDYLQDLGVSCLYFTPIFASPSNHRYDASDYDQIDPRLGTEVDLRELVAEAERRGLRVLMDGVFNHCSSDSIYFKAARADKLSPHYRWFNFPHWPQEYTSWLGVTTMPEFVECPEVEDFFFGEHGIAFKWLAYGTAGWRTDVTPWLTDEFWRRFRRAIRSRYPEAYIVAEDWDDVTARLLGDSFDATMNYRFAYSVLGFAGGKLTPTELDDRLETMRRDTPPPFFHSQLNLLTSHDTARLQTILGSEKRVRLATALQLAYPGVPMIYYGEEAGLTGRYAEDGRRSFPWANLPQPLHAFFRTALNVRRSSAALSRGDAATVYIDEQGGYGILRTCESEQVLALFNNGVEEIMVVVELGTGARDGVWHDLLGSRQTADCTGGTVRAQLAAGSVAWFSPNQSR